MKHKCILISANSLHIWSFMKSFMLAISHKALPNCNELVCYFTMQVHLNQCIYVGGSEHAEIEPSILHIKPFV